ncbi:MAG: substrate-binding domain-containing protein [Spirochaetes bacterium]|nr:substrate-binding domain-containing protein [Spirochaetota bacterium]
MHGPYYSHVFHWIEKETTDLGLNLMYFSTLEELPPLQLKKKVDGLIVAYFPEMKNIITEYARYIPITCIGNIYEGKHIPSTVFDNLSGSYSAISYLADLGMKRIAYINGILDSSIGINRLQGYNNAVHDLNLDNDPDLIYSGDYFFESGIEGATHLLSLKKPPQAIVCGNDNMAFGVMRRASQMGISIPDELSVIGFDDIESASHMNPSLTTIHVPLQILIKVSVKNLMTIIQGNKVESPIKIIPTQLIVRDSTIKI